MCKRDSSCIRRNGGEAKELISDKIAFVILTWNSKDYLSDCLMSVLALQAKDLKIHIVDNGSRDGTCALLKEFQTSEPDRIDVIYLEENEGTTKSRNRILKEISADTRWICILDSDTVINEASMEELITALIARPRAMIAAPRMWRNGNEEELSCKHFPTLSGKIQKGIPLRFFEERGLRRESYPFFPDPAKTGNPPVSNDRAVYEVDYAISACWMMRREVIDAVGLLDEKYFYAPEDADYCAMIWEKGYEVLFASGSSIYHNSQRLSHRKLISAVNLAHLKGLLYYFQKHRYLFSSKIRR